MLLGDSTVVRLISRLKSRVDNLKAIFVHIDNSAYPPLVVRETLIKYFHKLCREQPGVVSVRYSFDSFNVFLSRSMELSRAANPNLPDEEYDTSLAKVISPIEEDDTSVSSGSLSTSEGGGGD
ncbi:hypothetical protein M408DRAFT_293128 [Serendipita vermifera MAFF 305830]|uniref:Uncharacterized protein n=1 Tax=Serendipita vermifera MAFF 305830 TaxID=933852 RepID=A0A0C3ABZ9_SERVB|nr:hypothetical protein M408DRAFT_293128 [Serendipita vermifera MAFF 305830]